ncbi:MAG: protein phosphatase 2C domain-containing protein [Eubacteriales bacterium]
MYQNSDKPHELIRCSSTENGGTIWGHAISCRGKDHVRHGEVCQDYCGLKLIGNTGVFVVSDGHSSAVLSQYGSKFAFHAMSEIFTDLHDHCFAEEDIVRYFRTNVGKRRLLREWEERILDHAASDDEARKTLAEHAKKLGKALSESDIIDCYGATFLGCIVLEHYVITLMVGDGLILLFDRHPDYPVVPVLEEDDIGERTLSLSHRRYDYLEAHIFPREKIGYLFMTTDGISKPFRNDVRDIALDCIGEAENRDILTGDIERFMLEQAQPFIGDDISLLFAAF